MESLNFEPEGDDSTNPTLPTNNYDDSFFYKLYVQILYFNTFILFCSTCFEHYCVHLQEGNCISTASGIVTLFR